MRRRRMRKWVSVLLLVSLAVWMLLGLVAPQVWAATQELSVLSYKFHPTRDVVFVDFHNPYFSYMDNIVVNMTIKEGTGRNRVLAIGQTRVSANLTLAPGEHTSALVPIRGRVVRDIPALAQFEFKISGRMLATETPPPDVVVQDSENGITLSFSRDANQVPHVMGFIELAQSAESDAQVDVDSAVLTFLDKNRHVVWSETIPVRSTLTSYASAMIWQKFDHITPALVPDISHVEAKFVLSESAQSRTRTSIRR